MWVEELADRSADMVWNRIVVQREQAHCNLRMRWVDRIDMFCSFVPRAYDRNILLQSTASHAGLIELHFWT